MESDKSAISISQLASLGHYLDFDVMEELEKQGIVFNQNNKKGDNNGIVLHNLEEIKALYDRLLSEKDMRLKEKDEMIDFLKNQLVK